MALLTGQGEASAGGMRNSPLWSLGFAVLLLFNAGLPASAEQPDYPDLNTALSDVTLDLGLIRVLFVGVANMTSVLLDPRTNAIVLLAPSAAVQQAIKDFNADKVVRDPWSTRAAVLFLMIPQPAGSIRNTLQLADRITLDTALTIAPEKAYADNLNRTLTTLTFRDLGSGLWYVGGSPPGAILNISRTYTAGDARIYLLDGHPVPPSKMSADGTFTEVGNLFRAFTIAEGLADIKEATTYMTLAMADADIKAIFTDNTTAITVFAPSNDAWQAFFTANGTSLEAMTGSQLAQDLILGSMVATRPYMTQQFPAGATPVYDSRGRTFNLLSSATSDAQLSSPNNNVNVKVLPGTLRDVRGGKSIMHVTDSIILPAATGPNPSPAPGSPPQALTPTGPLPPASPGGSAAAAAAAATGDGGSSGTSTGAIVGAAVGGVCGAILLTALAVWLVRKRQHLREAPHSLHARQKSPSSRHLDLPKVHQGLFTRVVAHEYSWTDYVPVPGKSIAVEAGINDRELDALLRADNPPPEPPVVKLSREELQDQVLLLKSGILGRGATAMVFQCVWPSRFGPNTLLAIKVLKDGSEADPHHLSSFAYEAEVLRSLSHPNIVRVYGYCLEPPTVCIILELLPISLKTLLYQPDGVKDTAWIHTPSGSQCLPLGGAHLLHPSAGSLGNTASQPDAIALPDSNGAPASDMAAATPSAECQVTIAESDALASSTKLGATASCEVTMDDSSTVAVKKLSMESVLLISTDIAAGLAHMHGRTLEGQASKVVHRDLKPANILLNSRGRAKISDFGLARQHHRTTIGTMHLGAGTLPYMAPELLVSAYAPLAATNRVDIYSLAILMWELLAGHTPWQGCTETAILAAVTQGQRPMLPEPPTKVSDLDPAVLRQPAALDTLPQFNAIIRDCWRQRELRRPTAMAVHVELCRLLEALGVQTDHKPDLDAASRGDSLLPPTCTMPVSSH